VRGLVPLDICLVFESPFCLSFLTPRALFFSLGLQSLRAEGIRTFFFTVSTVFLCVGFVLCVPLGLFT